MVDESCSVVPDGFSSEASPSASGFSGTASNILCGDDSLSLEKRERIVLSRSLAENVIRKNTVHSPVPTMRAMKLSLPSPGAVLLSKFFVKIKPWYSKSNQERKDRDLDHGKRGR